MELNARSIRLLQILLQSRHGVLFTELTARLKITRRILYYDLQKVNQWLCTFKLGKVDVTAGWLLLETDDAQEIFRHLKNLKSYIFSAEERRALIILMLTLSAEPVTGSTLQSLLSVSKNTIQGDISACKKGLQKSLRLCGSTPGKRGYCLIGDETVIRKLIGRQMFVLKSEQMQMFIGELLQKSMELILRKNRINFIKLANESVAEYERFLGTQLVYCDMTSPDLMILSACVRSIMGFDFNPDVQEKRSLENTREYSAVLLIMRRLSDAGIDLHKDEAYYITALLLGINNFDFDTAGAENDFIRSFAAKLVNNFENVAGIIFGDKDRFTGRLYLHIRPMYYRLKYGIEIDLPLARHIKSMYAEIYEFTHEALKRTDAEMSEIIPDGELAYLSIYMASYLGEQEAKPVCKRPGVLIICGAGVASSVLLRDQLSELLGDSVTYSLASARQAESLPLSGYCIVVTTVPIERAIGSVIQTGAILSEGDRERIIDLICKDEAYSHVLREVEEILHLVSKHSNMSEITKLKRDLFRHALKKGDYSKGVV